MRLGQLLVDSGCISQAELSAGLSYAQTKTLPIGRCLILLRSINEEQLQAALRAQQHLRNGLATPVAVEVLRSALRENASYDKVLERSSSNEAQAYVRSGASATAGFQKTTGTATIVTGATATGAAVDATKSSSALIEAGEAFLKKQQFPDAEAHLRAASDKLQRQPVPDESQIIRARSKLAEVLFGSKKFAEGEVLFEEICKAARSSTLGTEDTIAAKAVSELADGLALAQRPDLALRAYILAGELFENRLPSSLADCICNLRAASVISRVVPAGSERKRLGELFVASGYVNDVQLQQALAKGKELQVPLGNALEQMGIISAQLLRSVMHCQLLIQDSILAEPVAIHALRIAQRQQMDLGTFLQGANIPRGKEHTPTEKQISDCLDNLIGLESKGQAKSPEAGALCLQLGKLYVERGSMFDAEFSFRRAQAALQDQRSQDYVEAVVGLSTALIKQGRKTEAHSLLSKAMTAIPTTPSNALAEFFDQLSLLEFDMSNTMMAFSMARSALSIMDQIPTTAAKTRVATLERLATSAEEMGDANSVVMYLNRLLDTVKQIPDTQPSQVDAITKRLSSWQ